MSALAGLNRNVMKANLSNIYLRGEYRAKSHCKAVSPELVDRCACNRFNKLKHLVVAVEALWIYEGKSINFT